jgi:hypothetical protein
MLARSGPLPTRPGWSFEPKWDGFRALVRTAIKSGVVASKWTAEVAAGGLG